MPNTYHGRRLSYAEYTQRLTELQRGRPPMPSAAEDAELRRRELDLIIDRRLGTAFPAERREALWQVQQRLEKRRLWLVVGYLLRRVVPSVAATSSRRFFSGIHAAYSAVLSPHEVDAFFGDGEPGAAPDQWSRS